MKKPGYSFSVMSIECPECKSEYFAKAKRQPGQNKQFDFEMMLVQPGEKLVAKTKAEQLAKARPRPKEEFHFYTKGEGKSDEQRKNG